MISAAFKYGWAFVLLILLQVLILNNLHLSIYVNPYVYLLIILILPFETPGWLALSLAFVTGLTMDAFGNTPGMHTAALVFTAFIRHYALNFFAPRDGYESGQVPHYHYMGMPWFLIYAGLMTLIHHLFLFTLEDFHLNHLFTNFLKAFSSTFVSLILMVVLLLASYKPRR